MSNFTVIMINCGMSKGRGGKSGRVGDETLARIEDLKGGWTVSADGDSEPADSPAPLERPGSARLGSSNLPSLPRPKTESSRVSPLPVPTRKRPGTNAPPIPPPKRKASLSSPPPVPPKRAPSKTRPPALPGKKPLSSVIIEGDRDDEPTRQLDAKSATSQVERKEQRRVMPPAVIVQHEIDDNASTRIATQTSAETSTPPPMEERKRPLRPSVQSPVPSPPVPKGPPSVEASMSAELSTEGAPLAKGAPEPPPRDRMRSAPPVRGKLPESIPRTPGVFGDVAYLFRVMRKRKQARSEIESLASRIVTAKESRHEKLVDMARHAVGDESFDQTMVDRARASLLTIEEKRSQHAGRVAAVDEKIGVLQRSSEERLQKADGKQKLLRLEIESIQAEMTPLKVKAAAIRKRAAALKRQLQSMDAQIQEKTASLVSVDGKANQAGVNAALASLRAERVSIATDEPVIAAQIDEIDPEIAGLRSQRSDVEKQITRLEADKETEKLRLEEKIVALKAGRVVEKRKVQDRSEERQERLLELGEELHDKPPQKTSLHEKEVEKQDLEIGILERQRMDVKELLLSVERAPMTRGMVWIGTAILVVIALIALVVLV